MCHSQRTNKNEEIHDFFLYSKKTLFFFPNLTIFFFIIALLKVPTGWIFFFIPYHFGLVLYMKAHYCLPKFVTLSPLLKLAFTMTPMSNREKPVAPSLVSVCCAVCKPPIMKYSCRMPQCVPVGDF